MGKEPQIYREIKKILEEKHKKEALRKQKILARARKKLLKDGEIRRCESCEAVSYFEKTVPREYNCPFCKRKTRWLKADEYIDEVTDKIVTFLSYEEEVEIPETIKRKLTKFPEAFFLPEDWPRNFYECQECHYRFRSPTKKHGRARKCPKCGSTKLPVRVRIVMMKEKAKQIKEVEDLLARIKGEKPGKKKLNKNKLYAFLMLSPIVWGLQVIALLFLGAWLLRGPFALIYEVIAGLIALYSTYRLGKRFCLEEERIAEEEEEVILHKAQFPFEVFPI